MAASTWRREPTSGSRRAATHRCRPDEYSPSGLGPISWGQVPLLSQPHETMGSRVALSVVDAVYGAGETTRASAKEFEDMAAAMMA